MRIIGAALLAILLVGCGPNAQNSGGQKSTGQDIAETMAQKGTIDAGRRTADKVRAIGAQEQQNRKEAGAE